jgi:8-oxo-dGTP diphosphatase
MENDPCYARQMLKELIGGIWGRFPRVLRRMTMRMTHARFTVTAAAIVVDQQRRVLLLKHRFRPGTGWGIPGGFIEAGEQPDEGVRRELREEVGLELGSVELLTTRAFKKPRQIEIVFRCHPQGDASPQSIEVRKASWFAIDALPEGLPADQRRLINDALNDGVKPAD